MTIIFNYVYLVSSDVASTSATKSTECPLVKCRANCGNNGYVLDENGCQTCKCVSSSTKDVAKKQPIECSRVMCRMFCEHGYRRNENGCEICQCNDLPQPCPEVYCENKCPNGYRKDYSGKKVKNNDFVFFLLNYFYVLFFSQGCQTCQCDCPALTCGNNCTKGLKKDENGCLTCSCIEDEIKEITDDNCSPMKCDLDCKYGYQRDLVGCSLCACNVCPLYTCRMFCMYGFKRNKDGCEVCECDWTPVSENIQCSRVNINYHSKKVLKIQIDFFLNREFHALAIVFVI